MAYLVCGPGFDIRTNFNVDSSSMETESSSATWMATTEPWLRRYASSLSRVGIWIVQFSRTPRYIRMAIKELVLT